METGDEFEAMMRSACASYRERKDHSSALSERWPGVDWYSLVRQRVEREDAVVASPALPLRPLAEDKE